MKSTFTIESLSTKPRLLTYDEVKDVPGAYAVYLKNGDDHNTTLLVKHFGGVHRLLIHNHSGEWETPIDKVRKIYQYQRITNAQITLTIEV